MFYDVREKFGPESGQAWTQYLQWRGLSLTHFASLDGMLRPSVFDLCSDADYRHSTPVDFTAPLITNLDHARLCQQKHPNTELVGIEFIQSEDFTPQANCLGYEIIDSHWDVSLLTNWGQDKEQLFSKHIAENGLVSEVSVALRIRDMLRQRYKLDHHAVACEVWAVYLLD